MADALADNKGLQILDLGGNNIGPKVRRSERRQRACWAAQGRAGACCSPSLSGVPVGEG